MRLFAIVFAAAVAISVSAPAALAKHWGSYKHPGWNFGRDTQRNHHYVFPGKGHHYGWYKGRGNPHRNWRG